MHHDDELHADLTDRLRALGTQPVDPATASQHLTAIASVPVRGRKWSISTARLKVGAAFAAGLLLGGTGLASAGALGPLQPAASSALSKAGIEVPGGTKDKADKGDEADEVEDDDETPVERSYDDCPTGMDASNTKNHGQAVKSAREAGLDHKAVAKSDCGKPVGASDDDDTPDAPNLDDDDGDGTSERGKVEVPVAPGDDRGRNRGGDVRKDRPRGDNNGPGSANSGRDDDADDAPENDADDDAEDDEAGEADE